MNIHRFDLKSCLIYLITLIVNMLLNFTLIRTQKVNDLAIMVKQKLDILRDKNSSLGKVL